MSLWRDELKPTAATLATVAVLGVVSVLSLERVVEAPAVIVYGGGGLAIGAGFAIFFGARSLGLGFVLMVGGVAFTLPVMFTSDEGALPSAHSFTSLWELISAGFSSIPDVAPPVSAQSQYLVLVWMAMLLLGFLSGSWVVVRRPLGAVVTLLAVVTFTGSVGDGSSRNAYAVAAVAATGAFFLAEGRHRIRRWAGERSRLRMWMGMPALAASCAVALAAPAVIGDSPMFEIQSAGRPTVVIIKPLSDIRRQLEVDPPIEVLRVAAGDPAYWRLTALDSYDGREWVLEARPRELEDTRVGDPEPPATGDVLQQRYTLTSLLSPWLPAAYAATEADVDATVQVDEGSQTLLLRDDTPPGLTYTVSSRLPRVAANLPAELLEPSDETERWFGQVAATIVGDASTPLDIAQRLEEHFRGYTYDEEVPGGHDVGRLQSFLEDRSGYCEQFAATMTLMLRGLGIDARVGVGFLPGAREGDTFFVSTRDAHAWVEVNIPGSGWVIFDPTPGRASGAGIPERETQPSPPEPQPQPEPEPTIEPQPTVEPVGPQAFGEDTSGGLRVPRWLIGMIVAATLVASVPGLKALRRARRRSGTPEEVVLGAWDELVDRALELGHGSLQTETIREFAWRVFPQPNGAQTLATLTSRTIYGAKRPTPQEAASAWQSVDSARKALRARTTFARRTLSHLSLRPLMPRRDQTPTGTPSSIWSRYSERP